MTELINALDNHTPVKEGENGHAEYGYSHPMRERVVQFSFQLTRISKGLTMYPLEKELRGLLTELKRDLTTKKWMSGPSIEMLIMLYKMIGHTRDVNDGKGEYALSYMMIYVWEQYWSELAVHALRTFVKSSPGQSDAPYGSWKDIKHFCTYIMKRNHRIDNSELLRSAIVLMNSQLSEDFEKLKSDPEASLSLAGKWAPREKSVNNGWLHEVLALDFFSNYLKTAKTPESKAKATLKAKMDFRKMLSKLNLRLGTVQVKQCAQQWADIEPSSQTSITMFKQKRAFLNKTKKGEIKNHDPDRIICAVNFNEYIEQTVKGGVKAKGGRVSMTDFTKEAIVLLDSHTFGENEQTALLDAQWANSSEQTGELGNMVAMVDTSGSMCGDPLYAAMALGIRVAEKSALGKRVMTFDSAPEWVNLDGCTGFTECVKKVRCSKWGMTTNFYMALDLILKVIVEKRLSASVVQGMVLAVFSDMQINAADSSYGNNASMSNVIAKKYADAGVAVNGTPYTMPHILFWNLKSTDGFPALSTQPNVSMLSGFSPALLNMFCEKGWQELQLLTPWNTLKEQIDNPRYDCLQNACMAMVEDYQKDFMMA
jgi:hypothetical protein